MRILYVCPTYRSHFGGVSEHVKNIAERLAKRHDVTVFATDPIGFIPKEEVINGVRVKRFRSFAPNKAYYFSPGMLKELRKATFDIVHGHAYHAFPLFFSRYAKRSKKLVVTPHYHEFGHTFFRNLLLKLYKPIGKRAIEDANKIICVSKYEKDRVLSNFKVEEKKLVVIPNGIDREEFKDLRKKLKKKYRTILFVGAIEKYKGISFLIKALQYLDDDIRLETVGIGTYKKKMMTLVKKLGLENRVIFQQCLSRKELLKRYASADLFVLVSKYEAFGISVAEALASKTPCIVANSSALQEWIDNENCFGINYPININELANLIDEVIGKEVQGVKLLDWDDVVKELIKTYEDCQQQ